MRFSDTEGHENAKATLRQYADSGRVPHAVMLEGPAGTRKMQLARVYAQYLHCEHPSGGEPCGECPACRLHGDLNHPDLHFVYPVVKSDAIKKPVSIDYLPEFREMLEAFPEMPQEKWTELLKAGNKQPTIYVEEADDIIRADAYPAYSAKYKIFIIWLPEKMQPAAANKLLKVVEEPSEGTIFIFVSDNPLMVLPTISSRTQRILVGAEGRQAPPDAEERDEFRSLYQDIMRAAFAVKPSRLKQLADITAAFGREKIRRFLEYANSMARENFLYRFHNPTLLSLTPEEEAFSRNFAPYIHEGNVEDFISETDRARMEIERNANAKIVLFDYFLLVIILLKRKKV